MPPCFANSLIGVSHPGVPGLDILEIIFIYTIPFINAIILEGKRDFVVTPQ